MSRDTNLEKLKREQEESVAKQFADAYNLPYIDLDLAPIQESALPLVDRTISENAWIIVFHKSEGAVQVAVSDPKNNATEKILDDLKKKFKRVDIFIASKSALHELWQRYPSEALAAKKITGEVQIAPGTLAAFKKRIAKLPDVKELLEEISQTDATQAFDALLGAALALDSTDIHIEPQEHTGTIRMKIDGILYEVAVAEEHLGHLLLSRTKLLAKLKLNIHDQPQEGRFSVHFENRTIEIRASILPSEYGEDIALRILDPKLLLSLPELGLREDLYMIFTKLLEEPQGLILVTGPTGSGKTTTLYASIRYLKKSTIKVITIEDPIEYHLDGITQTQIDEEEGYTFETGIRSMLRQDPDILLVGELRSLDATTAALEAALAGRKVLTTLHTVDAVGAIPRLVDLGVDPPAIASALQGAIAQRLVRRLCAVCKQKRNLDTKEADLLNKVMTSLTKTIAVPPITTKTTIYDPSEKGCINCRESGYKGRIAIFEIFVTIDDVKNKIAEAPGENELRKLTEAHGMSSMKQDAILKVLEGITSLDEVQRILGEL